MNEEIMFEQALAQAPEERAEFLDQACAERPGLRAAVEALLAAHERSGNILDRPPVKTGHTVGPLPGPGLPLATGEYTPDPAAVSVAAATAYYQPEVGPGLVIAGRYTLVEKIGEGGMGEVWVARQTEPVKRKVALKLIKTGMDSKAVLQRFEQERQALALMDHPNIARVLDGGMMPNGQPYFAMELVNGLPLNKYCDAAKLGIRERLELFTTICQSVQHAHQKGIIHRDLKPTNILVTLIDGKPVPKVIDFGVAKATSGRLTDESLSTQFGAVVGTLEYMSPEQAAFSGVDIDTRADIYSLGVILYELLTGLRPIDARRLKKAALTEMIRIIQEEEPSKPSTRLSTDESLPSLAAVRQTEPRKLMAMLRGELDWVVMKCLEKQRDRRYETANGLARDIQRYLADEVVEARPPSAGYRLKKFVRRHKGQVIAASLVLFTLLAGMAGTTWGLFEAQRQESIARAETAEKEKARLAEAQRVKERDNALALEAQRLNERDKANDELKHRLGVSDIILAGAAYDNWDVRLATERLEKVPAEQRGWEWPYLKQQIRGGLFTIPARATKSVVFNPDGTRFATGGRDNDGACEVKVWEARTGTELLELKGLPNYAQSDFPGVSVAFSPDGTRIVIGDGSKTAKVCDARTGAVLLELKGHTTGVMIAAFSPDGARIVTGGDALPRNFRFGGGIEGTQGPGETKVWDARTGSALFELKGHTGAVTSVAFSPDGRRIVTGGGDWNLPAEVKVWDAEKGGKALLDLDLSANTNWKGTVAFSPDGSRLIYGNDDETATVVDAQTGAILFKLKGHGRDANAGQGSDFWIGVGVLSASFSPDGTRIVTTGGTYSAGEVTVWDARTGMALLELKGHTYRVTSASFSPDGTRIVTGSADGTVKMWDARTGTGRLELVEQRAVTSGVAFSPDGTRIATANMDGTAKVWDVRTGVAPLELKAYRGPVRCVAFSPDGARIITGGGGGEKPGFATVWDARTAKPVLELHGLREGVGSLAFSPDGTRIATGGAQVDIFPARGGYELKVWDARTGTVLYDLTEPAQGSFGAIVRGWKVAFSPDGSRFVAGGGNDRRHLGNVVIVRDARTGKALVELKDTAGVVLSVSFSADGKRIVTGGADNSAKVWDAETGALLQELKGHRGGVLSAAFNPGGTRIVTGSYDKTVKVWDVRTGSVLVDLKDHSGAVQSVAFSPDGTQIVTGGGDTAKPGEAFVWVARVHNPGLMLQGDKYVSKAAFSPDGTRLATIDESAGKIWDLRSGLVHCEMMRDVTNIVANLAFSLDGTRIVTFHHDKSTKVWDAKTGQELSGEAIPNTVPVGRTSPDGRLYARLDGTRVELMTLTPDPDELAYRRLHTEPNLGRYRDGYRAARASKDDFAAKFYLELLPPAERPGLIARADVAALVSDSVRAKRHLELGKPELALPLLVEIANVKKAKLGPDDPDTLETMNLVGVVHWRLRQFDKSVPVFEEVLKGQIAKLGRDHPQTLNAMANLGTSYKDVGRFKEAIPLLEEAQRAAQDRPELGWVAGQLIDAYKLAGEYDKAAILFLEPVPQARQQLPKDSPQLGGFLAMTAMNLLELKKWALAEPLLRESLAIRERSQPEDWSTFNTRSMLGGSLLGQKKYADAEPLLLAGYEGMKKREAKIPTPGKPRLPEAVERLAQLYEALGKKEEASKWRLELEQVTDKIVGPVHDVDMGLELTGKLEPPSTAVVYQVSFVAGKTYVIDMVSPDPKTLDPFLVLSDAAGMKLAEDDDSGGGLNARITFRAVHDGTYRIQATSFGGGRGAFTLTIREQALPPRQEKN